jgi:hypothetical protein
MKKSKELLPGAIQLIEKDSTIAATKKDVLSLEGRINHETSLLDNVQVENKKIADDLMLWRQRYGNSADSEAGLDTVIDKKAESDAEIKKHETKLDILEDRKAELESELVRLKTELKNTLSLLMRQIREELIGEMKDRGLEDLIFEYYTASLGGDRDPGLDRDFMSHFCPSGQMSDKQRQDSFQRLQQKYFIKEGG